MGTNLGATPINNIAIGSEGIVSIRQGSTILYSPDQPWENLWTTAGADPAYDVWPAGQYGITNLATFETDNLFQRSTIAIYRDASGIGRIVPKHHPRTHHHTYVSGVLTPTGVLLEPPSVNYYPYGDRIGDHMAPEGGVIQLTDEDGPIEGKPVYRFTENTNDITHSIYLNGQTNSGNEFCSIFVKAAGRTFIQGAATDTDTWMVNLTDGSITTTGSLFQTPSDTLTAFTVATEQWGNGWWRIMWKNVLETSMRLLGASNEGTINNARGGTDSYTGDGTSGFLFACYQEERDVSEPTSYIPTYRLPEERHADELNIQLPAGISNPTIYAEVYPGLVADGRRILRLVDLDEEFTTELGYTNAEIVATLGSTSTTHDLAGAANPRLDKVAWKYTAGSQTFVSNHTTLSTTAHGETPTELALVRLSDVPISLCGSIARLTIWDSNLSDGVMQTLTTP